MLALSFVSPVPATLFVRRKLRPEALLLLPKLFAALLKDELREFLIDIGREEAFPLALDVKSTVPVDEVEWICGKLDVLALLLPLELPNQLLFCALEAFDGALLLVSASLPAASAPLVFAELPAPASFSDGAPDFISTNSASRYHFRRRVYRPHPS